MLQSFFTEERVHGGWRFWVLWVVLTNVGFFVGILAEQLALGGITLAIAVPLAAFFQSWVLNRHIVIYIPWILVTAIGWWIGLLIAPLVLNMINMPDMHPILRYVIIGAVAGFVVGIPQWYILRGQVRKIGWWWVLVSAVGWASMAPGLITGIPLAQFIEYDYRDLVYRSWKRPEDAIEKPTTAKIKAVQP
jgi:hypothetical protein